MRHMIPKEIFDAVDLQPQYRTFSEIRDYMLQQWRQRADVYVGDVCRSTKESWYSHSTSEHKHEHSHCHKDYHSSPNGCVSDELRTSRKMKQRNRRVTRTTTSKTRNVMEMKGMQSRERSKGGFKGTSFKCGTRGQKADRCWQKGTGKGSKGDWEKGKGESQRERDGPKENGQSLVTRGTVLGTIHTGTAKRTVLKVDPWSAVEPVPFAVSLSSSWRGVF